MALGLTRIGSTLMQHALIPLLSGGGAGGAGTYFLSLLGDTGFDDSYDCAVDGDDNVIVCGNGASDIGTSDGWVAKYDSEGTAIWAKAVGVGSSNTNLFSVAVDSNGDIVACGTSNEPPYGNTSTIVVKLDGTDGSLLWDREIGSAGFEEGSSIAVDSSDNVFIVGRANGGASILTAKWNSSGVLQWQRTLASAGTDNGRGIAVDSSGNVYGCGVNGTTADGHIWKRNTSGTLQWQYRLTSSDIAHGIAVDASGNIYVHTSLNGAPASVELTKLTSTPAVSWTRKLTTSAQPGAGTRVAIDSNGDATIVGSAIISSVKALIAKWDASGSIQLQRTLGDATGSAQSQSRGAIFDSTGALIVAGDTQADGAGNRDAMFARLPADGSGTGTYGNIEYASASLTEAAGSVALSAGSMTEAAGSFTEADANMSVADLTFTLETFEVS